MTKIVKIIFTLSILLNIALAGTIVGSIYKKIFLDRPWHEIKAEVAPETQKIFDQAMAERRTKIFEIIQDMRAKRQVLQTAVSAEPFDPAAFEAAVMDIEIVNDKILTGKMNMLKEVLSKVPQAERAKMGGMVIDMLSGRRGPGGKHGKDGPRPEHEGKGPDMPPPPPPGEMPPPPPVEMGDMPPPPPPAE